MSFGSSKANELTALELIEMDILEREGGRKRSFLLFFWSERGVSCLHTRVYDTNLLWPSLSFHMGNKKEIGVTKYYLFII